jgi:NADH:ubiquinone oxidoreductase subunit 6 (subunit J)
MKKIMVLTLFALLGGTQAAMASDGSGLIDAGLWITYILFIVCAAGAALVFPILQGMKDPASFKKTGIALAGLLGLFLISYIISGNEVTETYKAFGITEGSSKFIGAMLITSYLMIFVSIGGIIYGAVAKFIK